MRTVTVFAGLVVLAAACSNAPANGDAGGMDASVGEAGPDLDAALDADTAPGPDVFSQCDPPADAGLTDGGGLPNLTINRARIAQSVVFDYVNVTAYSCEIVEGCLLTPGRRRVMRFDLETPNDGTADVSLGFPGPDDPRFEFSSCHGHRHFLGYAAYSLRNDAGVEVGRGHKQSFCLEDTRRTGHVPSAPRQRRYNCTDGQGIQAGWADVYSRELPCQYVDVTDVAPGAYTLHVRLNERRSIPESNYDDNEADVPVTVTVPPADTSGADLLGPVLRDCPPAQELGELRDCGWMVDSTRTCTPGARVTVGCNAGCATPVGSCSGDPMMRVCAGDGPCLHGRALGLSDDACQPACRGDGNACPMVAFACPPEGRYTVLVAGSYDHVDYLCDVAAY